MVRRIRICSICSKRFIALHGTHFDCCRRKSDKNDEKMASVSPLTTFATPEPIGPLGGPSQCNTEFSVSKDISSPNNVDIECFGQESVRTTEEELKSEIQSNLLDQEIAEHSRSSFSNHADVVELLSDEENDASEGEDDDEPILVDLLHDDDSTAGGEPKNSPPRLRESLNDSSALLEVERNADFEEYQQDNDSCAEQISFDFDQKICRSDCNQNICFGCGSSLSLLNNKGRIQHIKRCSKKHGVTVKDVRFNDDYEHFVKVNEHENSATSNPIFGIAEEPTNLETNQQQRNPYSSKRQQWHGDAPKTCSAAVVPNVNGILMAGARRAAKVTQIQRMTSHRTEAPGLGKRPRLNNNSMVASSSARTYGNCPKYKLIPGTDFCCDGFHYAKATLSTNYFLTHFHSDHYGGIHKSWNIGTIYCSLPTANLVHQQLGVDRKYLHPLPLHTPTVIASKGSAVTVTLLNANHCPGAIMFLFEVGKRVILHVGDFRWNYNIMSSQLPLRPFCRKPWSGQEIITARRIDDLFLDTTYCDAQYDLPTQADCIQAVIKVAEQEMSCSNANKKYKILMLFGAYTIGKEAVYMAVAKSLGVKVYVDKRRYRILSTLDWSVEDVSILTTDPKATNVWVVPLGHINMKKMASYKSIHMKGFSRDFDRVVGFRPTGWSLSAKKHQSSIIGTTSKGSLTLHTVPYSEHSSFPELVECLETLNPKRVIPTVNASKSQQQVDLLLSHWRDKQSSHFVQN